MTLKPTIKSYCRFNTSVLRGRLFKSASLAAAIFALFIHSASFANDSSSPSVNLLSAHERGVSGEGLSKGTAVPTFDEIIKKDVLEFDYSVEGSTVNVWAKNFPPEINKETAGTALIQVRIPNVEQLSQVSLNVELKGSGGIQNIPLALKRGWNSFTEAIDWNAVGTLSEAAFITAPIGSVGPANGTMYLALEFLPAQSAIQANPQALARTSFSLFDASEKGVFNMENAHGSIISTFDGVVEKDVLEF